MSNFDAPKLDLKKIIGTAIKSVEMQPDYVMRPKHANHRCNVIQWRYVSNFPGTVREARLINRWRFIIDFEAYSAYRISYIAGDTTEDLNSCDFIKPFTFSEAVKFIEHAKANPENDGKEWVIAGFVEVWR